MYRVTRVTDTHIYIDAGNGNERKYLLKHLVYKDPQPGDDIAFFHADDGGFYIDLDPDTMHRGQNTQPLNLDEEADPLFRSQVLQTVKDSDIAKANDKDKEASDKKDEVKEEKPEEKADKQEKQEEKVEKPETKEKETPKKKGMSIFELFAAVLALAALILCFTPLKNAGFVVGIIGLILAVIGIFTSHSRIVGIISAAVCVIAVSVSVVTQVQDKKQLDEGLQTAKKTNEIQADEDGSNTDQILSKELDVTLGEWSDTADDAGNHTTQLPVTVTSKDNATASATYSIHLEAVDGDGNILSEDTIMIANLGKGQSQSFTSFQHPDEAVRDALSSATFKIADISKYADKNSN